MTARTCTNFHFDITFHVKSCVVYIITHAKYYKIDIVTSRCDLCEMMPQHIYGKELSSEIPLSGAIVIMVIRVKH